jgi:hypothetical protein
MFKPYTIINNILDDPYALVQISKNIGYFSNEIDTPANLSIINGVKPGGNWRGYRSYPLHDISSILFSNIFNKIIQKVFEKPNFRYNIQAYLHILTNDVKYGTFETWHRDERSLFAGVVYLNPLPDKKTGTLLNVDGEIINVENVFNRLLIYDSNILHAPDNWLSIEEDSKRLTLTFFIDYIEFKGTGM